MQPTFAHRFSLPRVLSKTGQKPKASARIGFVILGGFLAFLLANGILAAILEGQIYPGVSVAGHDISGLSRVAAREKLSQYPTGRTFTVKVGDKTFTATSEQLGAEYDIDKTVDLAYQVGRSSGLPLVGIFTSAKSGQLGYSYNLNTKLLTKFTTDLTSQVGTQPINATLKVTDGQIELVPNKDGMVVDQTYLNNILSSALTDGRDQTFSVSPRPVKAELLSPQTEDAKAESLQLLSRSIILEYNGRKFIADRKAIGYWLTYQAGQVDSQTKLQTKISKSQVEGWVQAVANQINLSPISKKVIVANGDKQTVEREGRDGLAVDQKAASSAVYDAMSKNQDLHFNLTATPIPFKTEFNRIVTLDYGRYVEINISKQQLYVYQDSNIILTSPVTTGSVGLGRGTPIGLFSIYDKRRNTYLNGAPYGWSYNLFVNFWMPFSGGNGLHDAPWRKVFGGSDYYYGGSHGCVNLPYSTAAFIYDWSSIGTPVWVHN